MMDSEKRFKRLRIYNVVMGFFHLAIPAVDNAMCEPYRIPKE